jgi:hypothetical protein
MYLYVWEFNTYPRSNEVLYVPGALLTRKCYGLVGLAVGVHYVCTPQGGSQYPEHLDFPNTDTRKISNWVILLKRNNLLAILCLS